MHKEKLQMLIPQELQLSRFKVIELVKQRV